MSSKGSSYDPINKIWRGPVLPPIFNTEVSVGYLVLTTLKQNPDKVMVLNYDSGAKLTCSDIYSRTVKISSFLDSKSGLKQGDIVGVIAKNSENIIPTAYACFTLGYPINPLLDVMTEDDIAAMYSKTRPKAIFCDFDMVKKVENVVTKLKLKNCKIYTLMEKVGDYDFIDDMIKEYEGDVYDYEAPLLPNISSTPMTINSSSGTTGGIKGIIRSHKHWIECINHIFFEPLGENSTSYYMSSSLYWAVGINYLLANVFYQFKLILTSKEITVPILVDFIERWNLNTFYVDAYLSFALKKLGKTFPSVRAVINGGSAITERLIVEQQELFPNAVVLAGYGSTEADALAFGKAFDKIGSSGVLQKNVMMKIIDSDGNHLGPNEQGQICFKTPTMFDGYFGDHEMTETAFDSEGWAYTGDIGYLDDDGYIFIVDRIKHMLKYESNIFTPQEVQEVINEIPGVFKSCVVGVHDEGNDIAFAFVVKDDEKDDLTEEFIQKYVNEKVSYYKQIRGGVHFLDKLPMTPTRKTKNAKLKELAETIYSELK